ncbi:MAG: ATP-dependent helicase [Candidatus Omnitrophica bacterium]|jgi:DNA helicase-2/ATP-dependent DNA helicase PcrA|nr:ATP-dependent helicase [Candidatus Omnitrophota bacterium]MDD5079141.1 ATP-dependent helicase [Candidatus Omnitrophota bacterium]
MHEFAKDLNTAQLEVVKAIDGPILVIAGAGSGKTRVIEYRVLYLVRNNVRPQSILLLTFTRRAAKEMLSRAARHDSRCNHVDGGTFHSFAYQMLKKHSKLIGFDDFSILDEDDAQEAVGACLKKRGFFSEDKRAPRKDTIRKVISMSINKSLSISETLEKEYPDFADYSAEVEEIKNEYLRYKIEKGYFDYDDLLIYLRLLLQKNGSIRKELADKYRYIMVDEYQDTNKLQADITFLLAGEHKNVMVVGDDAQSIYGFRGASHQNILDFPKHFSGCRVIKLEENYRSHQTILDVANAILKNMKKKFSKSLVSAVKDAGKKPELLFFRNAYEETEWISRQIQEFRDQGIDLGRQAVLFRSAYISIPLQMELNKRNIPFQVFGGLKFNETSHVKDLLAHLKAANNPKDELAWNRLLMLIDGIGEKTASRIITRLKEEPGMDGMMNNVLSGKLDKPAKYSRGLARLGGLFSAIAGGEADIYKQFDEILGYYRPIMKEKFDDWQQRLNDLEALKQICRRYDSIKDFLADFALDPPEKNQAQESRLANASEKPLTLSTIHSAKGLEWTCVFLIGMVDGVLPVSFSLNDEDGIEEEQRLFYVAVTRARKHLILSLHHESAGFGTSQFNKVSRFLECPELLSKLEQNVSLDPEDDYDI